MKKAFSLIELSIVILIIGILVAGVTQGSRLVAAFRLQTAQTLTQNSPVISTSNLTLWYETSMENSFITKEAQDNTVIGTWYDINPQSTIKRNATQASASAKPKFYENVFNNALPGIRFDGGDSMIFDASPVFGGGHTIFTVTQRRISAGGSFIGGTSSPYISIGYTSSNQIQYGVNGSASVTAIPTYTSPTAIIITASLNTSDGLRLWINGGTTPDDTFLTSISSLTSWPGSSIGRHGGVNFNGDIAEVIIFNRTLKNEERQDIEAYLSKKYNIKIS